MALLRKKAMEGQPEGWYPDGERRERYWTGARWDARRQLLSNGEVAKTEGWYTDSAGVYHRVYPPLEEELQAERARRHEEAERIRAGEPATPSKEPTADCPHCHGEKTVVVEPMKGHKIAASVAFGVVGALAAKGDHTSMCCTACGAVWTLK